jgi:hypothetical protein
MNNDGRFVIPTKPSRQNTDKTQSVPKGHADPEPLHCTLFWDDHYSGEYVELYAAADGSIWGWTSIGDHWNDQVSSIIIHKGFWAFYQDVNFNQIAGGGNTGGFHVGLNAGGYPFVGDVGILNDAITSIKASAFPFTP